MAAKMAKPGNKQQVASKAPVKNAKAVAKKPASKPRGK